MANFEYALVVCATQSAVAKAFTALNRAPFAKSLALTGLRPSSLTSPTHKTVASLHQTYNSFFRQQIPGAPPPAPLASQRPLL